MTSPHDNVPRPPHAAEPRVGPHFVRHDLRRACANWLPMLFEPDADLRRIAEFAQADDVLAQAVLQMANAPAFGRRRRETRVDHAVALLGLNRLREWATRTAGREAAGIGLALRAN